MTDIAFYHLQRSPLERVLPKLLERTLEADKRALVVVGSEDRAEALAQHLWTYEQGSWLPHGTRKDGAPVDQPVWLTSEDENANQAQFLFLADGATSAYVDGFERCFEVFDGNDDEAVAEARQRWAAYKEAGHNLTYWQQAENGRWEQKAS